MTTAELDQPILDELSRGGKIDIITTGRQTGEPRRIEIAFHNIDGRLFISGMPGFKRSYIANLTANPKFTFHLKGAVTDPAERREVLPHIARAWKRDDVDVMVETSPLLEVTIDGLAG